MKWPHKVRIKTRISYEIVWVDAFDDTDCLGECRFEAKQIALLKGRSDAETFETLIHEVLHAIEYEYGVKLPHKSIYALEGAVHKILKLNGWYPKQKRK
jgi:hypothetical protein